MPESSPFQQVLCAIDGSEEALDGAYRGWCLAPGRPLTLVHVVDTWDAPGEEDADAEWVQEQQGVAEALLLHAQAQLLERGVDAAIAARVEVGTRPDVFRVLTGDGVRRLLTMGSGEEAEVESGPGEYLAPPAVDRLTRRVLDVAGCSVLINRLGPESGTWPQSITVGVDGSPTSMHAYETACALAEMTGAKVTPVMAVERRRFWRKHATPASLPDSAQLVQDEPADAALIRMDWHSDLVVVGRTGAHRSRGMGTTSEKVADFSPVPVLVVHRPEQA